MEMLSEPHILPYCTNFPGLTLMSHQFSPLHISTSWVGLMIYSAHVRVWSDILGTSLMLEEAGGLTVNSLCEQKAV